MKEVFEVTATIRTFVQSKPVDRDCSIVLGAESEKAIDVDLLSQPQNLSRLIPGFVSGKMRNNYKVIKIVSIVGPLGLKGGEENER